MEFPSINSFEEYFCMMSTAKNKVVYSRFIYKYATSHFEDPNDLISCNIKKSIRISSIIVFLAFELDLEIKINIQSLRIYNADKIIKYFDLADKKFWNAFNEVVKGSQKRKSGFLIQVVKALMFLKKNNVKDITYDDYTNLYSKEFYYGHAEHLSFPTMLERVMDKMNGKAMPKRVMSKKNNGSDYGLMNESVKEIVNIYFEEKYIQKGYRIKSPLFGIKNFFDWLFSYWKNTNSINDIDSVHWENYRTYIERKICKARTRQVIYNNVAMFFEWLQERKIVTKQIVEYGDRWKGLVEVESRMFLSRGHYKKIIHEIIRFEPNDEYEYLVKEYLIVISSTGFRASESLWIGPNSVDNIVDGIGEICLHVREKTGVKNKVTSIYPLGIEAITRLEKRLRNIEKIKFYNERTNIYVYSLFQYDGKLIGIDKIYNVFRRIMKNANLVDDYGNKIEYRNIKLHALRHQKYNDIFDATGGNASAVKIDSGHKHIEMTKRYTKQEEKKKRIEALKLVEQGNIIGKQADILRSLLISPVSNDKYLEVVKKLHTSSTLSISNNKNIKKYLGFGFCSSECKKVRKFCESCDFFYTCSTFESELKERYAKNFTVIKSRVIEEGGEIYIVESDKENIESLKYQEKWLLEIGVSRNEIESLKTLYCESDNNVSVK